jgi:hypothetical protein
MTGSLMMRQSVVVLLVGMLAGTVMGIQQDFALGPAHAHLNLIGGVLFVPARPTWTGWAVTPPASRPVTF